MKKIKKIAALFGAGAMVIAGKSYMININIKTRLRKKKYRFPIVRDFMKNTLNVLRIFAVH